MDVEREIVIIEAGETHKRTINNKSVMITRNYSSYLYRKIYFI